MGAAAHWPLGIEHFLAYFAAAFIVYLGWGRPLAVISLRNCRSPARGPAVLDTKSLAQPSSCTEYAPRQVRIKGKGRAARNTDLAAMGVAADQHLKAGMRGMPIDLWGMRNQN